MDNVFNTGFNNSSDDVMAWARANSASRVRSSVDYGVISTPTNNPDATAWATIGDILGRLPPHPVKLPHTLLDLLFSPRKIREGFRRSWRRHRGWWLWGLMNLAVFIGCAALYLLGAGLCYYGGGGVSDGAGASVFGSVP